MPSFKITSILQRQWLSVLVALLMIGVYILGLSFRRAVLEAQTRTVSYELPFTLESALHYRRVKMLFDRGQLPEHDEAIQFPEGINIREIDAVTSEPVQAFLAKFFPSSMSFTARLRWIEAGWFCLSIPLLAWMLFQWTGSWAAGFVSAALYAVALASILRSTGQEISRENFAFPWLMASYGFAAVFFMKPVGWPRWLFAGISVALLCIALVSWDMIQFVIGVIALGMTAHILLRRSHVRKEVVDYLGILISGLIITGLTNPYQRFHGLLSSPLLGWLIGVFALALYVRRPHLRDTFAARWGWPLVCLIGPVLIMSLVGRIGAYGSSYSHFAELLVAKIRFLNVKPDDPALLTYAQRIMWVPSLHSATWELTKWLFPVTLWTGGLCAIAAIFRIRKISDPLLLHWILLFGVSVAAYILFVRFHVFVILSACVLIGWAIGQIKFAGIGWRFSFFIIMLFTMIAEARHTLDERQNMLRPNVYYDELKELAEWLRENIAPDPVLANMGVSAYIATYAKCPIVLHPKFEDPTIRIKMETFGNLMFGDEEKAFRDWMDELGVVHLVYAKGEFAKEKPEYQMRYFANRLNPPDSSPARRFERGDGAMRYFKKLWGNHKYVVYRTFSRHDEKRAADEAGRAMTMLQEGRLDDAEQHALTAVLIDRQQEDALKVLRHVGSLRDQGFVPVSKGTEP